jgi:hypothetical protein
MTRDDINGGPAFPSIGEGFGNPNYSAPGMTLRDYFAAKAMQAVLTRYPDCTVTDIGAVARGAYEVAKVMLETRENMT